MPNPRFGEASVERLYCQRVETHERNTSPLFANVLVEATHPCRNCRAREGLWPIVLYEPIEPPGKGQFLLSRGSIDALTTAHGL